MQQGIRWDRIEAMTALNCLDIVNKELHVSGTYTYSTWEFLEAILMEIGVIGTPRPMAFDRDGNLFSNLITR